jgi:menaquinone-dependent protoporphyrinogen oxidase
MRVLVTAASRHGSTRGIADAVAETLREVGFDADVQSIDDVRSVEGYDAAVIGSAIYAGHWLSQARSFVDAYSDELVEMPVWLFSSGPVGDPPKPAGDPPDVSDLLARTRAVGHRTFAGQLDPATLGIGERLITTVIRVQPGDYRPWAEVRAWAREIAAALPAAQLAAPASAKRGFVSNWVMPR